MRLKSKAVLAIGALAALLPFGVQSVHAATVTTPVAAISAGISTPIDSVIDLAVNQMSKRLQLSNADRLVAREQMQFQYRSLTSEQQREIVTAARSINSEESVQRVTQMLAAATRATAEQALADARAASPETGQRSVNQTKLGLTGTDLVFVATAGPCRVADTRFGINGSWPGPVNAGEGRQIWAFSDSPGYPWNLDQGGTGTSSTGNCVGSDYPGSVTPAIAVVTLTVVDTSSPGSLIAWNGTPTLTVGSALAWNPGDRLANTTVVALNRFGAQFPSSGPYKRDFAVYNNSGSAINVVADVVGYFIRNQATALDCVSVAGTPTSIAAGASVFLSAPACPTGYTPIMGQPVTNQFGIYAGTILQSNCRISNTTGASVGNLSCDAMCCRLPGR